ncbi:hypothetical protein [Exiguobacterium sp. s57]|uniref:hypothetical protein n=1 Tax=Exiguobacterium sp. s57 TaxID=2751258 RepID=UPI001BE70040|nr:hypothetical protein [Exiguobacterium sp. s57]
MILLIPEEVKVELDVQLLAEIPPKPNERQRILDAVNDCQIVHLYLFLSEADEEVLYDTGTGKYLFISTELHEAVLSDEEFSTRLEDYFEAWNQLD